MADNSEFLCPCGSLVNYQACCGRYHSGDAFAPTAEALMRARYSAFALDLPDFVDASWDLAKRPKSIDTSLEALDWQRLEIMDTSKGLAQDEKGTVEFKAYYLLKGQEQVLHEISRFVKRQNRWYYFDGKIKSISNAAQTVDKGLNAPCSCGSGKKYKRCCGK